jgi:Trk-type K+ transport system membrane component
MVLIWEMKKKSIMDYLKAPFLVLLFVFVALLTSWIFHVSFSLYTHEQAHMSIFEWVEHLYALVM